MPEFLLRYFLPLAVISIIVSTVFFTIKKYDIIKKYKQPNSKQLIAMAF